MRPWFRTVTLVSRVYTQWQEVRSYENPHAGVVAPENLRSSHRVRFSRAGSRLPGVCGRKKKDPDEIGNRDVGKGVNFYSIEKEIALGKQMAQEVERQAKIVDDPVIAEYVNRVGQNLVRNSDAKVPFTIKVIDSEEINAFALPGGFFFVNTG